jgi:elongation factor Ts
MQITSEIIKKLRDKTGAGMMDCKRALEASNGDMEAAIEYLRKKGAAVAQKRADRSATEGMIVTRVSADGKLGVVVEVNCETDFVGKSEDFSEFAALVAEVVARHRPANMDTLHGHTSSAGRKIAEHLHDLLAKVGEKIEIRRFDVVESPDGVVSCYTHLGHKIGVLVEFTGLKVEDAVQGPGRDIAMQVAAMNPTVVGRDQIDKTTIDHELEIYRTQAKNEGKKEQVIDRIAMGKLEKFYQEVCLLEQTFIKDPGKTVKDVLAEAGKAAGTTPTVRRFLRFHLGEETK